MDEFYAEDESGLTPEELEERGRRKSRIGALIVFLGIGLVLGACGLTASNYRDDTIAGEAALNDLRELEKTLDMDADENGRLTGSENASGRSAGDTDNDPSGRSEGGRHLALYEQFPEMTMPTITINGSDYVGILEIPAIDRTLPVLDRWSYPGLKTAPNRYVGTPYMHDMIICAHNYDRHFGLIKTLEEGDAVRFTDVSGNRFDYEVTEVTILQPTQVEEMKDNTDWDLTLFTCTIGGATRVTVRCAMTGSVEGGRGASSGIEMSDLVNQAG